MRQLMVSPGHKKTNDLFLVIVFSKVMTFLAVGLSPFPPSPLFQHRLSSVLCKFGRKKLLISFACHPLNGVTRGGLPPSPVMLLIIHIFYCFIVQWSVVSYCSASTPLGKTAH